MPYITSSETFVRYPVVVTWASSGTTQVNSDLIFYAEAEINSRLSVAYTVPFGDPAPPTVKDLTMDIVYCRLLKTRGAKNAKKFCESLDNRIKAVVDGSAPIVTSSGTIIEADGTAQDIWSSNEDYSPTHSMLGAEDDRIDPDRLEAEWEEK